MTGASNRLRLARKHAGYTTANDAAEAFGWNVNTYKSHENGKRGLHKMVDRYAQAFNVKAGWLMNNEDPPAWLAKSGVAPKPVRTRRFPVLSWVAVNRYLSYRSRAMHDDATIHHIDIGTDPKLGQRVFFLPIIGESMIANPSMGGDSFHPGDLCGFDPDAEHKPGDYVLAQLEGEKEPMFRKYQLRGRDEGGGELIDLVPLNQDYATVRISRAHPGKIIARLVRHVRNY
jgi:SOS-response transcriptional repressor LexA